MKRIFFPFANPYRVMEFAAYLNYRGVPLEGAEGSAGLNSVAVVAKSVANEGPLRGLADSCLPTSVAGLNRATLWSCCRDDKRVP